MFPFPVIKQKQCISTSLPNKKVDFFFLMNSFQSKVSLKCLIDESLARTTISTFGYKNGVWISMLQRHNSGAQPEIFQGRKGLEN